MSNKTQKQQHIVFFHPDLGIGGAERLVVDAAVGLQNIGHKVTIFTSHCDPTHCFDEARDGTLDVRVRGNSLVPPSIANRLTIICAILRQLHLLLQIAVLTSELHDLHPSAYFIDQLSAGIPLLRLLSPKPRILFYCHFPDKLLASRQGLLKRLYRLPFDWLESWTTGASDVIVVNSSFTAGIFADAFPSLKHRKPRVVYPCVNVHEHETKATDGIEDSGPLWKHKKVLLSINRFERKKNVALAIRAFAGLPKDLQQQARLVVAGGYDPRMAENVSYHRELDSLASSLGLETATATNVVSALKVPDEVNVLFLLSVPSSLKNTLLKSARLLVYTPSMEHFGIVPLEAMLAGVPVLAADSGGPRETVVDGHTGWLRDGENVRAWTEVMRDVLAGKSENELQEMGETGRRRVVKKFSQEEMARRLNMEFAQMMKLNTRPSMVNPGFIIISLASIGLGIGVLWFVLMRLRERTPVYNV